MIDLALPLIALVFSLFSFAMSIRALRAALRLSAALAPRQPRGDA